MQINPLDPIATLAVLIGLWLIPKNKKWWSLYAFGCFLWIILNFIVSYYFGMIMNLVAIGIAIKNMGFIKNSKWCTCKRPSVSSKSAVRVKRNAYFICTRCFKPIQSEMLK